MKSQKDFKENGNDVSKIDFKVSDSIIFSISYLEANGLIVKKNVIELDRYSGFVKHEFRTSNKLFTELDTVKFQKIVKYFNNKPRTLLAFFT